jgi:V/A-type H+-transporting ATPase subunit I
VPADHAQSLHDDVASAGVDCGVHQIEPTEGEDPPTLIRYPKWARPIKALFDILETNPGYREFDLSPVFMIAMPIFSAMLVGDAGYGLILTLFALWKGKSLTRSTGSPNLRNMIMIFGLATIAWGILTANYFGVSPDAENPSRLTNWMIPLAMLWHENAEVARTLVIKISFTLGVAHLVCAHLWKLLSLFPDTRWLSELGWSSFLVAMYGVLWLMFSSEHLIPLPVMFSLFGVGAALIVLFSGKQRNPLVRIGIGIMGNLMGMINTFGDSLSYIRLMAVGLASYYIASAFNGMAGDICSAGWWAFLPAVLVVVFAHALNFALCLIAIFAHAVRLNMLELSTNAGVQWAGEPYKPFAVTKE